ncbi:MAG TPA: hypothetical protein VHV83_16810, partial [Armatimonadota bacterium]|nr:hypothetical protein [Armatimonadota bacterium]
MADGVSQQFPTKFSSVRLYNAPTRSLVLCFPDGEQLTFTFASPTPVLIQDDRQWEGYYSVRIGQQYENATTWPAEKPFKLDFTLTTQRGMAMESAGPLT